jgi:hypothetical protein
MFKDITITVSATDVVMTVLLDVSWKIVALLPRLLQKDIAVTRMDDTKTALENVIVNKPVPIFRENDSNAGVEVEVTKYEHGTVTAVES